MCVIGTFIPILNILCFVKIKVMFMNRYHSVWKVSCAQLIQKMMLLKNRGGNQTS